MVTVLALATVGAVAAIIGLGLLWAGLTTGSDGIASWGMLAFVTGVAVAVTTLLSWAWIYHWMPT